MQQRMYNINNIFCIVRYIIRMKRMTISRVVKRKVQMDFSIRMLNRIRLFEGKKNTKQKIRRDKNF